MKESELFEPVRELFEASGFEVYAEVRDCDVVARRDDEIIVIELKTSANLSLLIQATERQAMADGVYVAFPQPKRLRGSHWRGTRRVIKQLGLGLVLVSFSQLGAKANLVLEPTTVKPVRKNQRKRKALLKETDARWGNYNTGGTSQQTIVTAYRQDAILIAACLMALGPTSTRDLRALGTGDKTRNILADNHYGWFVRQSRGVYGLTKAGKAGAMDAGELFERARAMVAERIEKSEGHA